MTLDACALTGRGSLIAERHLHSHLLQYMFQRAQSPSVTRMYPTIKCISIAYTVLKPWG